MTRRGLRVIFLTLIAVSGGTAHAQRVTDDVLRPFNPTADLSVTVTDTPGSVTVGGFVTFTLVAVNSGPHTAMNVQLGFSMPSASVEVHTFQVVSLTGASGSISCPWGQGCRCEHLASGGRAILRWHVMTAQVGTFYSSAGISSDTPDPVSTNNRGTEKTGVNPRSVDLLLEMSDAPETSIVNHPITYTVDVVNQGPDTTDGVRITAHSRLEADVRYELESLGSATYVDCHGYRCLFDDFASGARARIRVTVVPREPGSHWVTAAVTAIEQDPDVNNNDAHELTVVGAGTAPIVHAGDPFSTTSMQVVELNGRQSWDIDGDELSYRWSFTGRPPGSSAVLKDSTTATPSFIADRRGRFVVRLVVNDGFHEDQWDLVAVTVENTSPIAHAGRDQTVSVGSPVVLDGGGSSDIDGNVLRYHWSLRSGPFGSGAFFSDALTVDPTFVPDLPGTYTLDLVVDDGETASQADAVVISTVNSRPVATAGVDSKASVGRSVTLYGSGSWDDDGDRLRFSWGFVGLPAGSA